VTRRGGMVTLAEEEKTPGRRKGVDDVSWADTNHSGPKMKKIHMVDSTAGN
jgi:hypothetical protein